MGMQYLNKITKTFSRVTDSLQIATQAFVTNNVTRGNLKKPIRMLQLLCQVYLNLPFLLSPSCYLIREMVGSFLILFL